MKQKLTIDALLHEAAGFSEVESTHEEPSLYGVTDGKAIGTYLEHKFKNHLLISYDYETGNSASGVDFPSLNVDMKVTSDRQPQSSCPFKNASQKIFGLGYHLLVFVYDKCDNQHMQTGKLEIKHALFIDEFRTADFQTSRGVLEILERGGNEDDLVGFILDRNLPVDEIGAQNLAERILKSPPQEGYLTISNALQWRLQYGRVIQKAGSIDGVVRIK